MLEDKLLIWKLKRGNRDALRLLYEKYKDNLRTIAGSMLNDTTLAEDILHDVFVSFAENVKHFQIKTSLKNYLIVCVVNRVRDEFRRNQPKTIELDKAGPISSDSTLPLDQLEANEKSQVLTDALAAIPYEQREVILLHIRSGLKFRAIAKLLGVSPNTVKSRYRYGLNKLRIILSEAEK